MTTSPNGPGGWQRSRLLTGLALIAEADRRRAEVLRRKRIGFRPLTPTAVRATAPRSPSSRSQRA